MQFGWVWSQVQKAGKESVAAPCSMCWWDGMATMLTPARRVCHRGVLDFGTASERSRPGMALLDRFRLTDRVALVTGAGRGIGQAIALAFAEMGADVVCAARTEKEIEATAVRVRGFGRRALALRCDVTDPAELEQLAGRAMADFGRVDLLVNNAGGFPRVRVNALAVGAVETSALRPFLTDGIRRQMEAMTPMRRIGSVEDVALAALWLCSPAGDWVTGKVVEVDGGTESTNWPFD